MEGEGVFAALISSPLAVVYVLRGDFLVPPEPAVFTVHLLPFLFFLPFLLLEVLFFLPLLRNL
ncbi:MAG: hypothetical protein QXP81_08635 [Nitrososphaerota archaeon]